MFGLNETEVQNGYDRALQTPFDPARDLQPGFFDGSLTAVGHGFKDASAKILQVAGAEPTKTEMQAMPMMAPARYFTAKAIKNVFGDSENFQEVIAANRPSPQTTGWLGQQLFALTSFLGRAIGGSVATGSPVGGAAVVGLTEGYDTKKGLEVQGVDESTATKAGVVTGVTTGLGTLAPAAVPGKLLTRVGSGAAINVAMGAGQRGATGKILEDGGYKDMAEQYRMLDAAAITTDAILGAGFGAIARAGVRPRPSDIDAALTANSLHQLELDSAPGIPTDTATRNAHVNAMDEALVQLAAGDKVTLDLGDDVAFTMKPRNKDMKAAQELLDRDYSPTADNSLADSGIPSDSTSTADSPLTQDLPVQRSADTPPSTFAKRAMVPSGSLRGETSNVAMFSSSPKSYHTLPDLQDITRTVREIQPELDRALEGIASLDKGLKFYGSRVKEPDSLAVKQSRRKPQEISDYLGGRLVADSPAAIEKAVAALRDRYQVREVDNFMDGRKPGGYRAVHLQIESDKGVSVEVQIQPKEIRAVQDKAHETYKKWQKVEADNGGKIPDDMMAKYREESAGARKLFDDAWKKWEKRNGSSDAAPKAQSREERVVERAPDLKIIDEDGKVTTAKDALERASAEEAQANKEVSVFEAAVQCFLEVGDA